MSVLAWITPVPLAAIGGKEDDSSGEAPCEVLSVPIRIDLEELKRLALSNIGTGKAAFLDLGAVSYVYRPDSLARTVYDANPPF